MIQTNDEYDYKIIRYDYKKVMVLLIIVSVVILSLNFIQEVDYM